MQICLLDRFEYGYWNPYKNCSTYLDFQQTQLKEIFIYHNNAGKLWEVIGVDMCNLNNKNYLCIVDNHSKFLIVKKADLSMDSLILPCKIIFLEYGLPEKIVSDVGCNFNQINSSNSAKNGHRSSYIIIILPPKQWTGRSMYKIHKVWNKNVSKLKQTYM